VRRRTLLLALVATIVVVILDQASKQWILQVFDDRPGQPIAVTGFLNLALVFNHGVSFGLANNNGPLNALLFTVLAAVIVAGLLAWLWRTGGTLLPLAIGMVIGGAVGNVVDRLARGAVTDFLDFHLGEWHWFVFNLADAAICVGVGLMVIDSLVGRRDAPR
jgi:lipoprotein signal peptidase